LVDVEEAWAVLGVAAGDDWDAVRASYRRLIREAHPDLTGDGRGTATARRAARLNEAYAVLSRAKRAGTLDAPRAPSPGGRANGGRGTPSAPQPSPPPAAEPAPPAVGVRMVGADTLLLAAPPEVAFPLLVEAAHRVGSLSYVDRSCWIFEVIVRLDGETGSLLAMLQARGHGTEAVFALESLERAASYVPEPVVREMIAALAS
jgi:curved DNA-binding protein CbpA